MFLKESEQFNENAIQAWFHSGLGGNERPWLEASGSSICANFEFITVENREMQNESNASDGSACGILNIRIQRGVI